MSNARNLGNITTGGATGATTASVTTSINNLIDAAPGALNTLNELAAALGDDANFSTTVTNSIATKLPLAGGTLTGDLILGDSVKAIFGAGSDLQIFHDGNDSFISDQGSGSLYLLGTGNILLKNASNNETYLQATSNDAVSIYYDNSKKLETTSSGIDVTGGIVADHHVNIGTGYSYQWGDSHERIEQSDSNIEFFTNNTQQMTLSGSNLGIGTTTPASPLHVQADGVAIRMDGTGNTTRSLFFRNTTFSNPAQIYADGSLRLRTEDSSTAIIFNTNSTGTNNERMRITSSGNVGINTDQPQFKLHVNKGTNNYAPASGVTENIAGFQTNYSSEGHQILTFSNLDGNWVDGTSGADSAFGWLWGYANNVRGGLVYDHRGTERMQMFSSYAPIAFLTADAVDGNAVPTDSNMNERLIILPGGNVGIGTNNPGARLHILNDSGSPAVNTNDTDPLVTLGTADGVHGGIDLHATQKYSTLRSTVYRTTSSDNFGFGYNAYGMGTIDVGRVDQGYTWNGTNGNGEYTGGVAQQPRYMRKACFSGQIIANNTYYTIAENMSESRFTIECFCGDASSRDYKKYVGYYTSQAYGVYGLTQVIHMNGGWNSGSFDMRVSVPNGNLSIDLRFSSYYNSSNIASWMCIYTSFV